MPLFSIKKKIKNIQRLQQNLNGNAFLAQELEVRLLEHLPSVCQPAKWYSAPSQVESLPERTSCARAPYHPWFARPANSLPVMAQNILDMLRDCSPEILTQTTLPYTNATFDGVIAHFVPFWHEDILGFFKEIRRILKADGIFLFSSFGVKTLSELKEIDNTRVPPFLDMHDVGDTLLQAQFQQPVVDMEILQLHYDDLWALFRDLKNSGLRSCITSSDILSRQTIQHWQEKYFKSKEVRVTLEVIYGYALGNSDIPSTTSKAIEIPIQTIGGRKNVL